MAGIKQGGWAEEPLVAGHGQEGSHCSQGQGIRLKKLNEGSRIFLLLLALLRHYAKQKYPTVSIDVKLGHRCKGHKGQALWLS